MATNTQIGNGIRRNFKTFGYRNFENSGTVLYVCNKEPLIFGSTTYHVGQSLTFDVGGTSYSKAAIQLLRLWWNAGFIIPAV